MSFDPTDRLKRVERFIWGPHPAGFPAWKMRAVHLARLLVVLARDFTRGEIRLWTMSLVYTTLLSMVPLLALSFSVLKAFGVHNTVGPFLDNLFAPLGPGSGEVSRRIIGFIERMNVGVLGAIGLAMLVYTVISLMQKIEESFNAIWHVAELRNLGERFSRYLSVLLVGPVLVFVALGITGAAFSSRVAQDILAIEPFGTLAYAVGKLVPYLLVIGAFTFLYKFVPNARVRFLPALAAGVVGGVLWQSAGWAFAAFVVSSTSYAAIYSSFAILVLLLIWLFVSWLVLLVGADVAFYVQHPEYLYAKPGEPRLSNRMRERLALAVMGLVGASFIRGDPPWSLHALTRRLAVPMHSVLAVVEALCAGGFLARSAGDPPGYLPSRDLARVSVADVLSSVRRNGEDAFLHPGSLPLPAPLEAILEAKERAIAASTGGISIAEVAEKSAIDAARPEEKGDRGVASPAQPV